MTFNWWKFKGGKSKVWSVFATVLLSFTAGALITTRVAHVEQVRADSNRVFELRIYHTAPGKMPAVESGFRDAYSKLFAEHNLPVVGYWVPEAKDGWDNTFVYLIAHSSKEQADKNWDAMFADPKTQEAVKAEEAEKLVEKVDVTYMRPTDFSPMK
jgi:hypothetical protein